MSKQEQAAGEFYIGWLPDAPHGIAKHIRKVVIALAVLVVTGGTVLALLQKKFSTANFEFGQLTAIKGVYYEFPVPSLKVLSSRDAFGRSTYVTIPLVGYGKFGAEGLIRELEQERNTSLQEKLVTFKGTLLYSDGKALLQIDRNDSPLVAIANASKKDLATDTEELGTMQLNGEVLDPKCYFGVMKPGHGKPHRDCATRCIAGGISPVFWVRNTKGGSDYYLILDENGEKMNAALKDHIGEPLSLYARAVRFNDWIVLYTDKKSIKTSSKLSWFKSPDQTISCAR
ncbi:MAG TPA: hypothetical protein VD993_18015 [Chitinophagaceae bacterium]|nr:hypothetical protein [Chitinophagaceae bacterium]